MGLAILIVDDSRLVRRVIRRNLEMSKIDISNVYEAGDGAQALQVLGETWIDMVFLDIHMPVMDGLELVERMSQDSVLVTTPVIIVSSDRNPENEAQLERFGIRAYIRKPFRAEGFVDVMREVLGHLPEVENAG